jgi:hypothetical protein
MCQLFMPWMHQNTLHDLLIPPDAKTQFQRNMSHRFVWHPHQANLRMKNSVSSFHALDSLERTLRTADPTECENTSSS